MKPVPPAEVIAEYLAAYERLYGANCLLAVQGLHYQRGWFMFARNGIRYRGAQIIHMTAQLNERAKAKG